MPRSKRTLIHARLLELLSYDPRTGRFTRLVTTSSNAKIGSIAGSDHKTGYRYICIDGGYYKEHRLVWFYVHGSWPDGPLDHVNNDPGDNRIENLRPATNRQNAANAVLRHDNRFGNKGIKPMRGRWQARIGANGAIHLGTFDTKEEAAAAYAGAARALYGKFARIQ